METSTCEHHKYKHPGKTVRVKKGKDVSDNVLRPFNTSGQIVPPKVTFSLITHSATTLL